MSASATQGGHNTLNCVCDTFLKEKCTNYMTNLFCCEQIFNYQLGLQWHQSQRFKCHETLVFETVLQNQAPKNNKNEL